MLHVNVSLLFIFIYVLWFRETFKPSHSFEFVNCTDVTAEEEESDSVTSSACSLRWLTVMQAHFPFEFLCSWNAVFFKWMCQIQSEGTVIVKSFFRPDELTPTVHCSVTRLSPQTVRCLHFKAWVMKNCPIVRGNRQLSWQLRSGCTLSPGPACRAGWGFI